MAINKLPSGNYQVKIRGTDGRWVTRTFQSMGEARAYESRLCHEKHEGSPVTNTNNHVTVDEYFQDWFRTVELSASPGWRYCQRQFYREYIGPILASRKLKSVTPVLIGEVLREMAKRKRSEQTQLHVFNLMRKMFRDAIELYQLLTHNPVLRSMKPKVPRKDAKHLNFTQLTALLDHVRDKEHGLAIWIQAYLGLRVSEVIALKWEDLDLERGLAFIQRSYSRKDSWVKKEKIFKDRPKGGKQHVQVIPSELLEKLQVAEKNRINEYVAATTFNDGALSYEYYLECLKLHCRELEIPEVGTHGLRHSTSELYLHYGATKDDLRQLYAHSTDDMTDRYIHRPLGNLERLAKVVQLFPNRKASG
jgi:integrase